MLGWIQAAMQQNTISKFNYEFEIGIVIVQTSLIQYLITYTQDKPPFVLDST